MDQQEKVLRTEVWIEITEHYRTHVGDPKIELAILMRIMYCGVVEENEHRQLGQDSDTAIIMRSSKDCGKMLSTWIIHKGFCYISNEDL